MGTHAPLPNERARFAARLNMARPSHRWTPYPDGIRKVGCSKCPNQSPFLHDMASHLYIIEEEL